MTASASDKEAVGYQGEIASVLEDMGCEVEIDNAKTKASVQEIPTGVEMIIKEETVRPVHASRIVRAFRRAGVVIATRINAMRGQMTRFTLQWAQMMGHLLFRRQLQHQVHDHAAFAFFRRLQSRVSRNEHCRPALT